jgi:hypothetical protein
MAIINRNSESDIRRDLNRTVLCAHSLRQSSDSCHQLVELLIFGLEFLQQFSALQRGRILAGLKLVGRKCVENIAIIWMSRKSSL